VPKYTELVEQTEAQAHRLAIAMRRTLESRRTELRAAARGLPRLEDLVALPRQRFDGAAMRLDRALLANTRAHAMRFAKVAGRLHPRLLSNRLERTRDRLDSLARRAGDGLARCAGQRRARLERVGGRLNLEFLRARVARGAERLVTLQARAAQAMATTLVARRQRLDAQTQMLATLSYKSVLGRGYALVRDAEGRAVRSVGQVLAAMKVDIEVGDGRIAADVTAVHTALDKPPRSSPFAPPAPAPAAKPRATRPVKIIDRGPQGSLF
jgi:exodeoxyribonuclease VII large subunit